MTNLDHDRITRPITITPEPAEQPTLAAQPVAPEIIENPAATPAIELTPVTPKGNRKTGKIIAGVGATAAVVAGGLFALRGGGDSETTPVSTEPAIAAEPQEEDPAAPTESDGVFNNYVPSVSEFPGSDYLTEENMTIYSSPEVDRVVESYGLKEVEFPYHEYGDAKMADYAWNWLHPNTYIDISGLADRGITEADAQALGPVYLHNYLIATATGNTEDIWGPGAPAAITTGGTEVLFMPTPDTYTVPAQTSTEGDGTITLRFLNVPVKGTAVEKITPLDDLARTSPVDWSMTELVLAIDPRTGQPVDWYHDSVNTRAASRTT